MKSSCYAVAKGPRFLAYKILQHCNTEAIKQNIGIGMDSPML